MLIQLSLFTWWIVFLNNKDTFQDKFDFLLFYLLYTVFVRGIIDAVKEYNLDKKKHSLNMQL